MPNKKQMPKIINPPNQNGGRVEALVSVELNNKN